MNRFVPRGGTDFYSGLMLVAISALAAWLVSELELGSAREMGPAYFPLAVAILLGAIGLVLMGKGLFVPGTPAGHFEMRPLILVLASFLAFALLIRPVGLVIAILAQVGVAHFASTESRPLESLLFGIGLATVSAILFVYLLGIPVSVFP